MKEEPVWTWLYLAVGLVVFTLVILSFALSYVELGRWATVVALGIACIQAGLIAWFSMELFESRLSVRIIALIAPLFVILLVGLSAADPATRTPQPILVPEMVRDVQTQPGPRRTP